MNFPFGPLGKAAILAWTLLMTMAGAGVGAQVKQAQPEARDILALIEANGGIVFAAAAADIDAAKARLDGARARLFPRATVDALAARYESVSRRDTGRNDAYGTFEIVQPIYDFGRTDSRIKAARSEVAAAEEIYRAARNLVFLEGLAVYFDLRASDLFVRSLNEDHASAYVRWERIKERQALNQASAVDVAEKLAKVEQTRLLFHRERSRNFGLRLRLEELTGISFETEMIGRPRLPSAKPVQVDFERLAVVAERRNPEVLAHIKRAEAMGFRVEGTGSRPTVEAFGAAGGSSRDLRGRNQWVVGARISWPLFDGGVQSAERSRLAAEQKRLNAELDVLVRRLRRQVRTQWMNRTDAFQQVIAARAYLDFANKSLLKRQRLYEQERVTDLGRAMIEATAGEAELIKAIGAFHVDSARLAVLLGESPGKGLDETFVEDIIGIPAVGPAGGFTPKEGSGFGQDDQNKIN